MSETLTERVLTRFGPTEHEELRAAAEAAGLSKAEAIRLAVGRAVDEGTLGKPRETFHSECELIQAYRRDYAVYAAVGDPILENDFELTNCDHRAAILTETAEDRALVATVARAIELGVSCDELLIAVFADFFEREPGAEIAEIPRLDLAWLEINFGNKS